MADSNKYVGVGYSVWFDSWRQDNPTTRYHTDTTFGPQGSSHWWGKPTIANPSDYLFMQNMNPNLPNNTIIDYHADLLHDANVDFIFVDLTNGTPTSQSRIWDGARALALRYTQRLASNLNSPQLVFFVRDELGLQEFYNSFWSNPSYNNGIFFQLKNKPLIFATNQLPSVGTGGVYEFLTVKKMWGLLPDTQEMWSFKQNAMPGFSQGYFSFENWPQEMSVTAATQQQYMYNEDNPSLESGRKGRAGMTYWNTQWDHVESTNPSFVIIWSWNEWLSANASQTVGKGAFVDIFGPEYSADIEPSIELGETYYQDLVQKVARYKRNSPNLVLRNSNSGVWNFKFFSEEGANGNDQLSENFTGEFHWSAGSHYQPIVGDFDSDSYIDVCMRDVNTGTWYFAQRNQSSFTFSNNVNFNWVAGSHYQPFRADFDGNGTLDVGLRDTTTGTWYIRYNDGSLGFWIQSTWNWVPGAHYQVIAGDFNGDGFGDIGLRDTSTGTWFFKLNDGSGGFWVQESFTWAPGSHYQPFVLDADEDGHIDIGMRDPNTGLIILRNGDGTFDFQEQEEYIYEAGFEYSIEVVR